MLRLQRSTTTSVIQQLTRIRTTSSTACSRTHDTSILTPTRLIPFVLHPSTSLRTAPYHVRSCLTFRATAAPTTTSSSTSSQASQDEDDDDDVNDGPSDEYVDALTQPSNTASKSSTPPRTKKKPAASASDEPTQRFKRKPSEAFNNSPYAYQDTSFLESNSTPTPHAIDDPFNSSFNSFTPHSTFVSSHYRIDPQAVLKYIGERKNLVYKRIGTDRVNIKDCPFCRKSTQNKPDNQWKLTVWLDTGSHHCFRCGSKGSWFDFKKKLGDIPNITNVMGSKLDDNRQYHANTSSFTSASGASSADASNKNSGGQKLPPPLPVQSIVHQYPTNLFTNPKFAPVLDYLLNVRGLTKETLLFYQIGACTHKFPNPEKNHTFEEQICITMPWIKTKAQLDEMKAQMELDSKDKTKTAEKKTKKEKSKTVDVTAEVVSTTPIPSTTPTNATPTAASPDTSTSISPTSDFVFPCSDTQVTERIKLRSLVSKGNQRLLPVGGTWNFFGWHTVPLTAEELVITEGEFDAMAVWQATGLPAVSLPNGARSLPVELLPLLEKFKRIYLWLDDDAAGIEGAEKFARKLGVGRCLIVKSSLPQVEEADEGEEVTPVDHKKLPKDANDALRQGADLRALVRAAQPLKHEQILQFRDIRNDVLREFTDPLARRGVQSRYLPGLNRLLKGHRPGELTVVTGATGVGKTTVLSQISLDYCSQGVNTLWGSFEIRNTKLARTMISQYANMNFSTEIPAPANPPVNAEGNMSPDASSDPSQLSEPVVPQPQTSPPPDPNMIKQFNLWADRFEQLPLYFMKFFGSNSVESVLDAMEYAVYVYDVEHILLDNLQFMLSEQGGNQYDRFEMQDRAIALFRQFASVKNVHITLVIHPRKENDAHALGVASIFGGAKATQEADNVLIIQKPVTVDENVLTHTGGSSIQNELARIQSELSGDDSSWLRQHRRIEVKKNRFDGELGSIPFKYDKRTCRIYEIQGNKQGQSSNSSGSTGSQSRPPPPSTPPPSRPRLARPVVFGGDRTAMDAALATENANRAALASMQPKPKAPKKSPQTETTPIESTPASTPTPTTIPSTSHSVDSSDSAAAPVKKKRVTRKKSPEVTSTVNVNPETIMADTPITPPTTDSRAPPTKKKATTKKKKVADPGSVASAPSLDSPPIEVVSD